MTTINSNVNALFVRNALNSNSRAVTTSMEQLSTGKRINSAKDDAAGVAIATRMTQQIKALDQAVRNANDAISLVQTAEGATQAINDMLQRMRELSIQAINGTNSIEQRTYLDQEFQQLKQQIVQIADNTEWNGFPVLNGTAGDRVGAVPVQKTVTQGFFVAPGSSPSALATGDLQINGVSIPASQADAVSPAAHASASAIAIAAAINTASDTTKVKAVVGQTTMTGTAMTAGASLSGTVTINGYTTPTIATVANDAQMSRAAVVAAINQCTAQTGVVAVDSGDDRQGVTLQAADGRNIEVSFNGGLTGVATGLKAGIQTGSIALESSVETPVTIGGSGVAHSGLVAGNFADNRSVLNTTARALVSAASGIKVLQSGDLVINGVAVPASLASADSVSDTTATTSSKAASAIAVAAAINSVSSKTGVTAKANPLSVVGGAIGAAVGAAGSTQTLSINGKSIAIDLSSADASVRRANIAYAINHAFGDGGVTATDNGSGVTLTSADGRNLSVWFDSASLTASSFGLSDGSGNIAGTTGGTASAADAKTLYATVSLSSTVPDAPSSTVVPGPGAPPQDGKIAITAGTSGFGSNSDFSALGFSEGTYGGKASVDMSPPRVGRISFQVGAAAGQELHIDLSDFGANGPITGDITKDVNDATPTVQIATVEGANSVLKSLDTAMTKVNATRANMGAVMNRLGYVIDNLTNVSMNTTASRSQIEDADYAKASSDLARTQIMQQAATAVLAQANTSQQSVLKLLQG